MATTDTLVADARTYVAQLLVPAEAALDQALSAVGQIGYTQLSYDPTPLPGVPVLPDAIAAPTLTDVTLELDAEPDAELLYQDISDIEVGEIPTFTATLPTLNLPSLPSQVAEFTEQPPAIDTGIVFPEPPDSLLNPLNMDAPVLVDRAEPEEPQTTLPSFDGILPTDQPEAPTGLQESFEGAYAQFAPQAVAMMDGYVDAFIAKHSPRHFTQLAALETQLATYMAGGTGLDPTVEAAIYERARSKNDAEARRVQSTAYKDAARRGHTIPGGAVLAAVQQGRQAAADLNAAGAREIVVMAAEYEQKNLQFAVTQSQALRATMLSAAISYHGNLVQLNGQALEFAKSVLASIIQAYETARSVYALKLDAYKAEASVYDVKLRAALAGIELYTRRIQALQALANIDQTKVALYRARIDSLQAYATIYRARIEAVQGRASLEKLRLDLFGEQVRAFSATVQAKASEFDGYKAAISGQEAVVNLHLSQVKAHSELMQTVKLRVDAKAEVVRAQALTNQSRGENYRTLWSTYGVKTQARAEVAKTKLENQRQQVTAFDSEVRAQIGRFEVQNNYYRSASEIAIKQADLSLGAFYKSADIARNYAAALAAIHSSNAKIHGDTVSAAMAGMNTLVAQTLAE